MRLQHRWRSVSSCEVWHGTARLLRRTPVLRCVDREPAHRVDDHSRRAVVDSIPDWKEVNLGARAVEVVPQPAVISADTNDHDLRRVVPHLARSHRGPVELLDDVELATGERDGHLDVVVTFCASALHAAAALGAVCAHVLDVDRCGDDLNVSEGELFSAIIAQPS